MRNYLLIGAGLALLGAGPAAAQMGPHGHEGMGGQDRMDDRGQYDEGGREGGGRGEMEMMHHMHHPHHEQGASFRLKRGDMEIDVHCSAMEPTSACVSAAAMLLEKAGSPAAAAAPAAAPSRTP